MLAPKLGGGRHTHGHRTMMRDRRLALLIGPVAANGSRAQPLAIHGAQRFLCLRPVAEGDEAVTTRPSGLHVPHNTGLRHGAKNGERLL